MRQRCSKAKLMVIKVRLADLNATTACHALLCDESIKRHRISAGCLRRFPSIPAKYLRRTPRTACDFLQCLRLRNHVMAAVSASWVLKYTAATFGVNSCKESQFPVHASVRPLVRQTPLLRSRQPTGNLRKTAVKR